MCGEKEGKIHKSYFVSSTFNSKRKIEIMMRRNNQRPLFQLLLALALFAMTTADANNNKNAATDSHSGADSGANVCYGFGCPFLPRDVFYDEDAKTALHRLKEPARKIQEHDPEEESRSSKVTTGKFLAELDSSGDQHRSTMTLCGYKGGQISDQINQDRSILVSPFMGEYQLLGVLDGHGSGGEIVSEYARIEIPKLLSAKLEELTAQQNSENNLLMDLNDEMTAKVSQILKDVFLEVDKSAPDASHSGGCTGSVALQLGSKLFLANAGDSQTIVAAHLGWNETVQVLYATREDKPDLPDERERVEKAGGRVQIPQSMDDGDSARVVYRPPGSNSEVGLAMSRSIGDWDAPGVTAEPIVDVLDLKELARTAMSSKNDFDCDAAEIECGPSTVNFFIVSATDGLMDFVTQEAVAETVGVTFFGRPESQHAQNSVEGHGAGHAHLAAEQLIFIAAKGWHDAMQGHYRDDITISASKVFPWEA